MFWTFNLSLGILATVLATLPNIGRIFVQVSVHSAENNGKCCLPRQLLQLTIVQGSERVGPLSQCYKTFYGFNLQFCLIS
jgi:hypothetical protein